MNRSKHLLKLVTEHTTEPVMFLWIMAPACILFHALLLALPDTVSFQGSYAMVSGWFYVYVSAGIALFGFALDIVRRRDEMTRHLPGTEQTTALLVGRLFLVYSIISIGYCLIFYLATRCTYGICEFREFPGIALRFYVSFIMFCSIGLLLALLPINYQSFRELIIIVTVCLLITATLAEIETSDVAPLIKMANPSSLAQRLMVEDLEQNLFAACFITLFFICMCAGAAKCSNNCPDEKRYS